VRQFFFFLLFPLSERESRGAWERERALERYTQRERYRERARERERERERARESESERRRNRNQKKKKSPPPPRNTFFSFGKLTPSFLLSLPSTNLLPQYSPRFEAARRNFIVSHAG
jgi:hypothetical protein